MNSCEVPVPRKYTGSKGSPGQEVKKFFPCFREVRVKTQASKTAFNPEKKKTIEEGKDY